jgi:hypothetical protein
MELFLMWLVLATFAAMVVLLPAIMVGPAER